MKRNRVKENKIGRSSETPTKNRNRRRDCPPATPEGDANEATGKIKTKKECTAGTKNKKRKKTPVHLHRQVTEGVLGDKPMQKARRWGGGSGERKRIRTELIQRVKKSGQERTQAKGKKSRDIKDLRR